MPAKQKIIYYLVYMTALGIIFTCLPEISLKNSFCQSIRSKSWLPLASDQTNSASPQVRDIRINHNTVEFKLDIPGTYVIEIDDHDQIHQKIMSMPECGYIDEVGHPMLPRLTKLIAIPSSCTLDKIKLKILTSESSVFEGYQIRPVPKLVEKISSNREVYFEEEYTKDSKIYSINKFYPYELIKIKRIGFIRDQKAIWLAIYPIQYNPVTQEIKAYHTIEVSLTYDGGQVLVEEGIGPLEEFKKNLFLNYDRFENPLIDLTHNSGKVTFPTTLKDPKNTADYLIITTDELYSNFTLDSLAHHRAEFSGFDAAVVKTSDVYQQFTNFSNDESIKDFIAHVYDYWLAPHIGDGHLGYVLFIGEGTPNSTNVIPTHFYQRGYSKAVSDYWYACINDDNGDGIVNDDDVVADIIIGRFSVGNHHELNIVARKTMEYEKRLFSNEYWRRKISLVNGFVSSEFNDYVKELYDYMKNSISQQSYYEISEELNRAIMAPDLVRSSFINTLNNGRVFLNVNAHGGVDNWGDSRGWLLFQSSDILSLSNSENLPIIFSYSCNTGKFADSTKDCLGETFLKTQGKGAIAFIGASEGVSHGTNAELNTTMFNILMNNKSTCLGTIFYLANIINGPFRAYNLLGDPALSFAGTAQHDFPDLSITSHDIAVKWSPYVGAPETVTAKVFNLGFREANDVSVQFFNGNPQEGGSQIGEDQVINSISGRGGYQTTQVLIEDVMEGELSVSVRVDPYNTIEEIEENNNIAALLNQEPILLDVSSFAGVGDEAWQSAAAFGDFDDDGYLDLYVANYNYPNMLYENNRNRSFVDVASSSGVADLKNFSATTFVDYDNDGKLDIYFRRGSGYLFYHNDGDGAFTPARLTTDKGNIFDGWIYEFIDYNNDGLLDIYGLADWEKPYTIYENIGDEVFANVALTAGLDSTIFTSMTIFGDYNNDGFIDLLAIRGKGLSNILFQNNGNASFSDVTEVAGLNQLNYCDWGVFGDYNNDGHLDLFFDRRSLGVLLYKNNGDGTFTDVTISTGLSNTEKWVFGGTFLDYNNDGYLDLFMNSQPIRIFKNNGNGTFSLEELPIHEDKFIDIYLWNTAIGDYDNDGDLDFYRVVFTITMANSVPEVVTPRHILYCNSKRNDNSWIIIKTRGTESNSFGIGARVKVVSSDLTQIRDVNCTFSHYIQNSLPVHFGLGEHHKIDTVEIRWPSGIVDVLTSVKVNTILTVTEGIGDVSVPESYHLSQNFPNPFNQATTIQYTIKGESHAPHRMIEVEINIFNIIGQEIKTLVNESKLAGDYFVTWDGKDKNGQQVATGVYFYQIKANEFVKTKKMIFLR